MFIIIQLKILHYFQIQKNIEIIYVLARCSIEILAAFILSLLILFSISNYTLIEYLPLLTFYFLHFIDCFQIYSNFFILFNNEHWNYSLDKILENINYDDFDIIEKVDVEFDFKNDIKIKDLSYKRDNKIIFNNFNCEIKKNSIVGINGKSGSGKTTLVKIISGLITDYDGKIEIDTKRLKEDEISSWQKNIGYVPQYNFLLLDSIMNNIAMSTKIEDINLNYLNQSIATVDLEKVFTKDQLSNSQRIGEDSVKISGGQSKEFQLQELCTEIRNY